MQQQNVFSMFQDVQTFGQREKSRVWLLQYGSFFVIFLSAAACPDQIFSVALAATLAHGGLVDAAFWACSQNLVPHTNNAAVDST